MLPSNEKHRWTQTAFYIKTFYGHLATKVKEKKQQKIRPLIE
jgi:hypothetical protein